MIESLKNVRRKRGLQGYLEGAKTIENLQVAPKDKDSINHKTGGFTDTSVLG